MYHEMARHISVDTTVLTDPTKAPAEIDRCLTTMMQQSRPVYIGVPVDVSHLECEASGLSTPIPRTLAPNNAPVESKIVAQIRQRMESSKNPIIIVDGNAARNDLGESCRKLSDLTKFPTFHTYMGKGLVDETTSNFGGLYTGAGSYDGVREAVESADAAFWIGRVQVCGLLIVLWVLYALTCSQTDFNTGEFTDHVPEERIVEFQRFNVTVSHQRRHSNHWVIITNHD